MFCYVNRQTNPAGSRTGDYYCSAFIDFNTYTFGGLGAGTIAIYKNGSGIKYATDDFRKANDDYNSVKAHVSFDGVLVALNATDTIDLYVYVLMDQATADYRAINQAMITLFKINND